MSLTNLLPSILSYTQRKSHLSLKKHTASEELANQNLPIRTTGSTTSLYLNLFLSLVGVGWLSSYALNFGRFVWDMITPGISVRWI